MFSNQRLEARRAAGLIVLVSGILGAAGCSSGESLTRAEETPPPLPAETTVEQELDSELTATEAAIAMEGEAPSARPAEPSSDIINPSAPRSYVVKRGDTLWDIASMILRDPWLWPEIWYVNPQVANPHLIYPGDVLTLAYGADGRPQIRLERGGAARMSPRLRSEPLEGAIPTIPYSAIAAFLARPSIVSAEDARRAPHVLAMRDGHLVGGAGHEIYVRNLDAPQNARFSVIRVGEPLRDPDDGDVIGYLGIYTGTAQVMAPASGAKPAKAVLTESARETLEGDRLFAAETQVPLNFTLGAPRGEVRGRIIAVLDGVELIGQYQIVAINRGTRHGVEPGHVLAVDQAGEVVRDRHANAFSRMSLGEAFAPRVQLPDERAGTLLVFKSYDRMSFGLIVGASAPMRVNDVVRNP